jgi:hypothetical protein
MLRSIVRISIDIGLVFVFAVGAWFVSLQLSLDETQKLILETGAVFAGVSIALIVRLESLVMSMEGLDELREIGKGASILISFCNALKVNTGIVHNVLAENLNEIEEILKDAANRHVTIHSKQAAAIIHYPKLFEAAEHGASIKASARILPIGAHRRIMISTNKDYISGVVGKKVGVTRVFIVPRDSQQHEEWEEYIKEHKEAGVNVRYIFDEELGTTPGDDVFIVDKPKMATKAVPNTNNTGYESVTVMTNHEWIAELEDNWRALCAAAHEWREGCLINTHDKKSELSPGNLARSTSTSRRL